MARPIRVRCGPRPWPTAATSPPVRPRPPTAGASWPAPNPGRWRTGRRGPRRTRSAAAASRAAWPRCPACRCATATRRAGTCAPGPPVRPGSGYRLRAGGRDVGRRQPGAARPRPDPAPPLARAVLAGPFCCAPGWPGTRWCRAAPGPPGCRDPRRPAGAGRTRPATRAPAGSAGTRAGTAAGTRTWTAGSAARAGSPTGSGRPGSPSPAPRTGRASRRPPAARPWAAPAGR